MYVINYCVLINKMFSVMNKGFEMIKKALYSMVVVLDLQLLEIILVG